jgi:hypothetical protein
MLVFPENRSGKLSSRRIRERRRIKITATAEYLIPRIIDMPPRARNRVVDGAALNAVSMSG